MKTFFKALGLASAVALSASVPAWAATSLRLAHAAPEADLQQDLAEFFKEQVEARSNGGITVTIFPSGQLGTDAAMIDGARSGIIDIAISGLNNFTGLVPDAGAFELPFIFPDRAFAYSVLDGEIGRRGFQQMRCGAQHLVLDVPGGERRRAAPAVDRTPAATRRRRRA